MTHYTNAYVTLNDVVQQMELIDNAAFDATTIANNRINTQSVNTRNQLKDFILEVSEDLYNIKFRDFVPYDDTLTVYANERAWVDAWHYEHGDYVFDLSKIQNRDLLSVTSITLDGAVLDANTYRIDTSEGYPSNKIILDSSLVSLPTSSNFSTSIAIVGTWGYHENPNIMWKHSGDSVQNASEITSSGTSLLVTDGTLFETYQYLKIEDEYLFVTAITSNTLTVERGVNGSIASAHANGVAIRSYQQTPSVAKSVKRMVIRAYLLRNGFQFVMGSDSISEIMEGSFKLLIPSRLIYGSV